MGNNRNVIEGPEIIIKEPMDRFEIVKKVVAHFIEFEKDKKGKGIEFKYPVEELSIGKKLYIHRPGIKWNFDFKVEIPPDCGLGEGRHDQIALFLRNLKNSDDAKFYKIWDIVYNLYHCTNNDVNAMLNAIRIPFVNNIALDVFLKVIKWLFIMEDIIYWHYEGRAFLYNFCLYVVSENDAEMLNQILEKIRQRKVKPEKIKKLLKCMQIKWESP